MKLYLIRHGETVDNVAQIYAGTRDSSLTNHGLLQATRLGNHFASKDIIYTQIFSSDLQRASKTAEAIRLAQHRSPSDVRLMRLASLREQDFGFYEGKPFHARSRNSNKTSRDEHHSQHKNEVGFKDVESKDSMILRANDFLEKHLLPLLGAESREIEHVVAVVSHGIMLSTMWRCLLKRLGSRTVSFAPGVQPPGTATVLEYIGAWSNTGYLQLHISKTDGWARCEKNDRATVPPNYTQESGIPVPVSTEQGPTSGHMQCPTTATVTLDGDAQVAIRPTNPATDSTQTDVLNGWQMIIQTINGREHLKGVKRTGGGVGSSQYDQEQKTIDTFFKKQKTG